VAGDKVVGQAVLQISLDEASAKRVSSALEQIGKDSQKTADHVRNLSQLFSTQAIANFGKMAVHAIGEVTKTIIELGERGAKVHDVSASFDVLAQSAGGASDVLQAMRDGVVGTMTDFDLMKAANKALGAGFIHSAEDAKTLAAGARALGKATGVETAEAFDKLTAAMAKGRVAGLKGLGLFVDVKKAVKDYQAAHEGATKSLTEEEKAQIVVQASMVKLKERIAEMAPHTVDFAERIEQAKVQLKNLYDQVAVGVAQSPVLQKGLQVIGDNFTKAFGGKDKLVATIVRAIEEFVIVLMKAGSFALSVAEIIVGSFFAWKTAFNTVVGFIVGGLAKLEGGFATVLEAMAAVSGSEKMAELAAKSRAAATDLGFLAQGYKTVAKESNDAGVAALDTLGKTQAALDGTIAAMEAEKGKTGEVQKAHEDLNRTKTDPDTHARSLEMDKQILDSKRSLAMQELTIARYGYDQKRIMAEQEAMEASIKVLENKAMTEQETNDALAQIERIKQAKLTAAALEGDSLKQMRTNLQNELALMQTSGLEAEQLRIEQARQKELQGLLVLKTNYGTTYTELVTLVNQKYDAMGAKAAQTHIDISNSSSVSNDLQKLKATETYNNARANYDKMLHDGKSTYAQLTAAHKAYKEAEKDLDELNATSSVERFGMIADAASSILTSLFGKNKAAAIAAALIDAASAIVKVFAQLGWWGVPAAAAIAAKTAAQIRTIRSTNSSGFAGGTPNLDFAGFGTETATMLHGNEAVIPQGKGHQLAGEIAGALPGAGAGISSADLDRLAERIVSAPINPVSVDVTLDGTKLGESLLKLSRTGAVRIHTSSLVTA